MEDHKIIDLYWARSQQAIVESDQKYGPYCRAIALGILAMREDAEECVNDTWLRAWNAMPPQLPLGAVCLLRQADPQPVPGPVAAGAGGQAGRRSGGGGSPGAGGLPAGL